MDPPPRRECDHPRRDQVDEEIASASHVPLPQLEPQEQPGFQATPMPQPGFFPPMTPKAYMNFWYAEAQAQAQAQAQAPTSQVSYPAIQANQGSQIIGVETFSRTIDAVVAKNWLKKISDTLTDMDVTPRPEKVDTWQPPHALEWVPVSLETIQGLVRHMVS